MMDTASQQRFIQPLDILFLRDNQLFGGAGDASQSLMPPWPSVFAGALRSRMLADSGATIKDLKNGTLPTPLDAILGTPESPGSFMLGDVTLAMSRNGTLEQLHPLPADLIVTKQDDQLQIYRLQPHTLPDGIATGAANRQLPILRTKNAAKPESGYWLNATGWQAYICGATLNAGKHLIATNKLWHTETRLGIALDANQRSAAEGQLYTSDAIALCADVGFCVTIHAAGDTLPRQGLLRLGGDGRGASVVAVDTQPVEPDWQKIQDSGRFRLTLTSPGLFPQGGNLPGVDNSGQWQAANLAARLVSQAVPRHEVISGWDMDKHQPKAAQRCAPMGSVYWFEGFTGDIEALRKLSETGLWNLSPDNDNRQRRAEGFNRVVIANA